MKTKEILGHKIKFERGLLTFALLATLTGFASVAGATYSLPADRSVTWKGNVGVNGDIPVRTTIYTTLSPSGGDDTTAIQTAITNCPSGQVVKLAAGTFSVNSPIKMKSGVTVRGAGMGATTIKGAAGMTGGYIIGTNGSSLGTSISLSAGLNKGSTTITTSTAHGWSVGDIILIDQLNDASADPIVTNVGSGGTCTWCGRASGTRSLGQVAKVAGVPNATTATLEVPLYWNYNSILSPQATKISVTKDIGIEELTVDNSSSGSANQSGDNATILLLGASNCWLLRVEGIGSYETMVRIKYGYRNTIRSSKFHEGTPAIPINGNQYSTSRSYGIWLSPASANLIENNQLYHLRLPLILNGPASGNVFSYNKITELYSDSSSSNFNMAAVSTHGAHPIMNLMEGNWFEGRLRGDDVWGSSSHSTFFRNKGVLMPNRSGGGWDVDIQKNQNYYNFIGNLLGTIGVESTYELYNVDLSGKLAAYRLGYTGDGDGSASGNDPRVAATALRHGNWDSVTNGAVWNGGDDRILPPSLYLSSKPSWWGAVQWPAIGPDVIPMYPAAGKIGSGTPWDSKTFLSPPTGLKVQ